MTNAQPDSKSPDLPPLPPAEDQPAQMIAGRYEVVQTLSGGMALVHLCRDNVTGQLVALKTFKPKYLSHRAARDLFLREGTMWVDIGRHPHIVRAYRVERLGDGLEIYLVLEWVVQPKGMEKPSLRAWLRPGRPLPLKQSLLFSLHIARGMKYACKRIPGLVHRDLKPENVLIGYDGQARVTDFGLASTLAIMGEGAFHDLSGKKESFGRTQLTQGAAGTPLYMSPEQWQRQTLDARADIYALGCIFYEMITGRFAAIADSREAIKEIHVNGRIKPPPPEVPRDVVNFLRKCIMPDRTQRFRDWAEVEKEIEALLRNVLALEPPPERISTTETREERLAAGHSYNTMGLSYLDLGKMSMAIMYFEQAVWIGRSEHSLELEGVGLGNLGQSYAAMGYLERALEFHKEHLAIARQIGDRAQEGRAYGDMGRVLSHLGDKERAIRYHMEELKIARELGDLFAEAAALDSLGDVYWHLADVPQAVEYYKQSLALARQVEDRARVKSILSSMGHVYLKSGDSKEAVALYHQALGLARKIGDRLGEGEALGDLGFMYQTLGINDKAREYYTQALTIAEESHDRRRQAMNLVRLADLQPREDQAQLKQIQARYEQALTAVEELGDRLQILEILSKLGQVYYLSGDYIGAAKLHMRALKLAGQMNNRQVQQQSMLALAKAYESWGDSSQAIQHYLDYLQALRTQGDWEAEYQVLPNLAALYVKIKQGRTALELGEAYLARALEKKDTAATIDAHNLIGDIFFLLKDEKRAADAGKKALALAREKRDTKREAISLRNLAQAYQKINSVGSGWQALRHMEKALDRAQESGDEALMADVCYRLAVLLYQQKKWGRAKAQVLRAEGLAEAVKSPPLLEQARRLREVLEKENAALK